MYAHRIPISLRVLRTSDDDLVGHDLGYEHFGVKRGSSSR